MIVRINAHVNVDAVAFGKDFARKNRGQQFPGTVVARKKNGDLLVQTDDDGICWAVAEEHVHAVCEDDIVSEADEDEDEDAAMQEDDGDDEDVAATKGVVMNDEDLDEDVVDEDEMEEAKPKPKKTKRATPKAKRPATPEPEPTPEVPPPDEEEEPADEEMEEAPKQKKPSAKKPAAAKAKKKGAATTRRPPFEDSELCDAEGNQIRFFAAYFAENPLNEDEPWEVRAIPPGERTLTGFVRVRCENSDTCPVQVRADSLRPRFVDLAVGTKVEVNGFPVGPLGEKYVVVESNEEDETFTVRRPGVRGSRETVRMHDVRRLARKTTDKTHYTGHRNCTKKHPDWFFSAAYRSQQYASRRLQVGIENGTIAIKSIVGAEAYYKSKDYKRRQKFEEANPDRGKKYHETYEPQCPHCLARKCLSQCNCGGEKTGTVTLANMMRTCLGAALTADLGEINDAAAEYLTGLSSTASLSFFERREHATRRGHAQASRVRRRRADLVRATGSTAF